MKLKYFAFLSFLIIFLKFDTVFAQQKQLYLADPTIFVHNKTYYLYGTGSNEGFKVYTSTDTKNWEDKGFALRKGDAFGTADFWAPQIFEYQNKFYMAYVANEQIAIAKSDSPLGPFKQENKIALTAPTKIIDPFIYFENGKIYLYHVRLQDGNRIYVAELTKDLSAIVKGTEKECISATKFWEDTEKAPWTVTEGPTVMKHKGLYYLFYSANDFRNKDYAVGYAVSKKPVGPWQKVGDAPILSRKETGKNGSGHGDFFVAPNGKLNYVFHTHNNNESAKGKRKTAIVEASWKKGKSYDLMQIDATSFRYLKESQ